ncbi:hypothetical protein [Endothiovibrio diazotrophicus]
MHNPQLESLFIDPVHPEIHEEPISLSASELRQLAYDRANEELLQLEDERRRMLERHRQELRPLEARIALNKRLMRDIVGE